MEHTFWKDGDYAAMGGIFVRSELKKFFKTLTEKGLNPVGIKIDEDSFNLEVIVERNQAYIDMYEKDQKGSG